MFLAESIILYKIYTRFLAPYFKKFKALIGWDDEKPKRYLYFSEYLSGPCPDSAEYLLGHHEIKSTQNNVRFDLDSYIWETRPCCDGQWIIEANETKIALFRAKHLMPPTVPIAV